MNQGFWACAWCGRDAGRVPAAYCINCENNVFKFHALPSTRPWLLLLFLFFVIDAVLAVVVIKSPSPTTKEARLDYRDSARAASGGGNQKPEGIRPLTAPREDNARIGAPLCHLGFTPALMALPAKPKPLPRSGCVVTENPSHGNSMVPSESPGRGRFQPWRARP